MCDLGITLKGQTKFRVLVYMVTIQMDMLNIKLFSNYVRLGSEA